MMLRSSTQGECDICGCRVLNGGKAPGFNAESLAGSVSGGVGSFKRSSEFLQQPIFNTYHNEHDMLRWVQQR
jgi:glycine dehydrogenase